MSMKTQLGRKIEPDCVAKAERSVRGRVPEFVRKMAHHAANKICKQMGIDRDAFRLPKNARL